MEPFKMRDRIVDVKKNEGSNGFPLPYDAFPLCEGAGMGRRETGQEKIEQIRDRREQNG
ncbi:MAG: hypothetical protein GTN70_04140 [Deltaproteobacteria bacterium]|nr:hypothetical protein [Deltaproteobacteria bacterium]NIS76861.1 hypothetical protein [Deltaproteobacteria bacterium]